MTTTDPQDELFPLVNEHDMVIGSITRQEANSNPNIYHRAAGVLIFDREGRLLIQKRSPTKDTFPDCWDISAAGHVAYGDDYQSTMMREIKEETGIHVQYNELVYLGKILIKMPWENEFWQVYRYDMKSDQTLTPHPDEVAEMKFVSIKDLTEMLKDPAIKWSDKARTVITTFLLKQ